MKYKKIKDYKEECFRRLSGVRRSTFKKMMEMLEGAEKGKKSRGGKPTATEKRRGGGINDSWHARRDLNP